MLGRKGLTCSCYKIWVEFPLQWEFPSHSRGRNLETYMVRWRKMAMKREACFSVLTNCKLTDCITPIYPTLFFFLMMMLGHWLKKNHCCELRWDIRILRLIILISTTVHDLGKSVIGFIFSEDNRSFSSLKHFFIPPTFFHRYGTAVICHC